MPLHPLKFRPIFRPMPWGGDRLRPRMGHAPSPEPTGEAWILSDVDGCLSIVANGLLAGRTLRDIAAEYPADLFGDAPPVDGRFPLLLKMLDSRQELSVQVHPDDAQAVRLKGPGHRGKTEAWVILEADPAASRIYAGFRPGLAAGDFRAALAAGTTPDTLHQFVPAPGDCVFLPAGTVHAIGAGVLLFEVQQTSDITYRLYDWGRGRELHVDDGLACADFGRGPAHAVVPVLHPDTGREQLIACPHFTLHRHTAPGAVGAAGRCTAVVCVGGTGTIAGETVGWGDVVLLPASIGPVAVAGDVTLLECGF